MEANWNKVFSSYGTAMGAPKWLLTVYKCGPEGWLQGNKVTDDDDVLCAVLHGSAVLFLLVVDRYMGNHC